MVKYQVCKVIFEHWICFCGVFDSSTFCWGIFVEFSIQAICFEFPKHFLWEVFGVPSFFFLVAGMGTGIVVLRYWWFV